MSKFSVIIPTRARSDIEKKEESVTLKLNHTQANPSPGSGLKTISELIGNEIEIAPYCRRYENGIIVWFWCQSQNSLLGLQGMYVSGMLMERLTTLFKQVGLSTIGSSKPSTTTALVPHTITIQADEFLKTMGKHLIYLMVFLDIYLFHKRRLGS